MFNSTQFLTAWTEWKEHFQKKTSNNYTDVAERKALATLWQRCSGREDLAIASIDYSIEKNWNAVYIKPQQENGYGQNFNGNQSNNGQQRNTGDSKMEAYRKW